ncbi:MAG: lipid-A-disaccharide synthase [Vampirovibrionales bacterium]|nr:lipid-A-disaccharide synthase [Vampirovibrionales bacterium]
MPSQTIVIVAGDPSGDIHAAKVVDAMRVLDPSIHWVGVGGVAMKAAGVELLSDQSTMGKVGLYGLGTIWAHHQLGQKLLHWIETNKPSLVLHVDYGGFNLWLAGQCKKKNFHTQWGLKNIHYIPPQVWASRKGRLNTIKRVMDHVFCIFPFEEALYQGHDIPVTFVSHPLVGTLPPPVDRQAFCTQHDLNPQHPIVAVFPGSRRSELDYLLKPSLDGLVCLNRQREATGLSPVQAIIPVATSFSRDMVNNALATWQQQTHSALSITLIDNTDRHALLSVADVGLIKSGTSTLEAALYHLPQVVIYKGHPVAAWLAFRLCYLKSWGLPNVLVNPNDPIVPELLQDRCAPRPIADTLMALMTEGDPLRAKALAGYDLIAEQFKALQLKGHAETHVAQRVLDLI